MGQVLGSSSHPFLMIMPGQIPPQSCYFFCYMLCEHKCALALVSQFSTAHLCLCQSSVLEDELCIAYYRGRGIQYLKSDRFFFLSMGPTTKFGHVLVYGLGPLDWHIRVTKFSRPDHKFLLPITTSLYISLSRTEAEANLIFERVELPVFLSRDVMAILEAT
jgi:hypothetical protein